MRQIAIFLFYLLILLLPIQLGRHFFFDFSSISGIRSDYLAPTIYLTDILAVLMIGNELLRVLMSLRGSLSRAKSRDGNLSKVLLFIICYLLFNSIYVAVNHWAAFYKAVKIIEFILLGLVIYKLKPKLETVSLFLSGAVLYSSLLAIWQFVAQKSIGGIFWYLGERTFYAGTPGIAAIAYKGNLLLRPYATFSHPNVLGGFLSISLLFIFLFLVKNRKTISQSLKIWYASVFFFGLTSLFLTFSKLSWIVALVGLLVYKFKIQKKLILPIFYSLITLSFFIPILFSQSILTKSQYWQERIVLIKAAIPMTLHSPIFGVGLNNSIVHLRNYVNNFPGIFIYQPIHNIYLLILAETGITGFILFLWAFLKLIGKVLKTKLFFLPIIFQLFFLGLFDHYLATLQQGLLLLTVIIAIAVSSRPSEARGGHRHQAGSR